MTKLVVGNSNSPMIRGWTCNIMQQPFFKTMDLGRESKENLNPCREENDLSDVSAPVLRVKTSW